MNLYGWSLPSFTEILGSKDSAVLERALALLTETLPKEPEQSKAMLWVRTLIESGFTFRGDRQSPSDRSDGGLLTVQMEAEFHVFAVYCIVRAIARNEHMNLTIESSDWKHGSVRALYDELSSCGFSRSKSCSVQYFSWMTRLSNGSPLFGDDFNTGWSFYTFFTNEEVAAMIPVFQAASDFKRQLPASYSDEAKGRMKTELSESGKEFIADLVNWFGQIQRSGQDVFILWS